MSYYITRNTQIYNFLWEEGIQPIAETPFGDNIYNRTPKLTEALESYTIRNYYFKNRR